MGKHDINALELEEGLTSGTKPLASDFPVNGRAKYLTRLSFSCTSAPRPRNHAGHRTTWILRPLLVTTNRQLSSHNENLTCYAWCPVSFAPLKKFQVKKKTKGFHTDSTDQILYHSAGATNKLPSPGQLHKNPSCDTSGCEWFK